MKDAVADLAVFVAEYIALEESVSPQVRSEMRVMLAVKVERVRKQRGRRGVKPKATTLRYGEIIEDEDGQA